MKVADFGIARAMNAPTESNLTQAGSVMGTATYFSPEQAQGAQPDPRSDLYSLGIVLYEMVCGRPPFSGENPVSIAYKQVHEQPQPLNQLVADVPKSFEAIVAKLLAKKPEIRYPTAEAVRDDLRRFRNGEPVLALASAMGAAPATTAVPRAAAPAATVGLPRTTAMPGTGQRPPTRPPTAAQRQQSDGRGGMYAVIGFLALIALVVGGIVHLAGKTQQEAIDYLNGQGLVLNSAIVTENNPDVEAGKVIRTDPAAGTQVNQGDVITLVISAGVNQVAILPVTKGSPRPTPPPTSPPTPTSSSSRLPKR
ncbi:MAG: serine/threonine protein kinase [Acidimicrobiaceae bacterium]|nr:serine/threonine protein kinase [Acidimicrobiaceae bacterium]